MVIGCIKRGKGIAGRVEQCPPEVPELVELKRIAFTIEAAGNSS